VVWLKETVEIRGGHEVKGRWGGISPLKRREGIRRALILMERRIRVNGGGIIRGERELVNNGIRRKFSSSKSEKCRRGRENGLTLRRNFQRSEKYFVKGKERTCSKGKGKRGGERGNGRRQLRIKERMMMNQEDRLVGRGVFSTVTKRGEHQ